jgi:hypothetical protein
MYTATKISIVVGIAGLILAILFAIRGYRTRRWDITDTIKRAVREKQARIYFELGVTGGGPEGKFFDIRVTNKGGMPARDIVIKIDGIEDEIKADSIYSRWPLERKRIKFNDKNLGMKELSNPKATLTYQDNFGLPNTGTITVLISQIKRADNTYSIEFSKQEPDEYNAYIRYTDKEYRKIYKSL